MGTFQNRAMADMRQPFIWEAENVGILNPDCLAGEGMPHVTFWNATISEENKIPRQDPHVSHAGAVHAILLSGDHLWSD